jgi:hypothetical protein
MWSRFCRFWRHLFARSPIPATATNAPSPNRPVEAPHEILKELHRRRDSLWKAIASYREFGYDHLAGRCREELHSTDRRILELRQAPHPASP